MGSFTVGMEVTRKTQTSLLQKTKQTEERYLDWLEKYARRTSSGNSTLN